MKKINEYKTNNSKNAVIKLNANEINSLFNEEEVVDILLSLKECKLNRYPDSDCILLREAYGKIIGFDKKYILAGNGSDALIGTVISAVINKGDKILTLNPDFSMYDFYSSINEGILIKLNIKKNSTYSVKELIALGKKENPKLIVFSNPNNPTGYRIGVKDIELLLENFKDAKVLIDEAYVEFSEESALKLVNKYKNLIITRTLSKAWGLAALRVGFLISNLEIIEELKKYLVPYNVSQLSQNIAIKVLEYKDIINENIEAVILEREKLYSKLKQIEEDSRKKIKFYPSDANFIFGRTDYKKELLRNLESCNIEIRNFNDDSFRITIGSKDENLKVIDIIKNTFESLEDEYDRTKGAI